jgi:hypothetical protein
MEGNDFLKGFETSPYCNNKLRKSFFPEKDIPLNSEISLSNQFAEGKSSVTDSKQLPPEFKR